MSGADAELLAIFAEEAGQCLTDLVGLLLDSRDADLDADGIGAMFRAAHTLKGSAGMVGVPDVQRVAHAMEDLLAEVRAGTRPLDRPLADQLLTATDGIASLLPVVLAGGDGSATAAALVADLQTPAGAPVAEVAVVPVPATTASATSPEPPEPPEPPAPPAPPAPLVTAGPLPEPDAGPAESSDAIRVPVSRLDQLSRLVGEVAAANLRLSQLLGEQLGVDPGAIPEVLEASRRIGELHDITVKTRLVPLSTLTDRLHRAVREVARSTGKEVDFEARGTDTELDRTMLSHLADPLLHLVRNAVDHGIEAPEVRRATGKPEHGTVRIHAMQLGSEVIVTVADDGGGIDADAVRAAAGADADADVFDLVFRQGLSTAREVSQISGRGVGLDVVRVQLEAVRGRVELHSEPGQGSEFRLVVPITLAVLPCLLVRSGPADLAVPMHAIERITDHVATDTADGRAVIWIDETPISTSSLDRVVGTGPGRAGPVIVVADLARRHGFVVGAILGLRDVVVAALSPVLPRIPTVAGVSVQPDGSILTILDVPGLIDRARASDTRPTRPAARPSGTAAARSSGAGGRQGGGTAGGPAGADAGAVGGDRRGRILVVDDAATVRELQRSILTRAGFDVVLAVDGADGLAKLAEGGIDLVVTDVEMPNLDGFQLTEAIRALEGRTNTPVIILTSRAADEDRVRGMRAGADGYLVKSSFSEATLLTAVDRLLGR